MKIYILEAQIDWEFCHIVAAYENKKTAIDKSIEFMSSFIGKNVNRCVVYELELNGNFCDRIIVYEEEENEENKDAV